MLGTVGWYLTYAISFSLPNRLMGALLLHLPENNKIQDIVSEIQRLGVGLRDKETQGGKLRDIENCCIESEFWKLGWIETQTQRFGG